MSTPDRDWEVFKRKHGRIQDAPMVTITGRGHLNLTAAAWAMLGEPSMVELLYSAEEQIVGLRASEAVTAFVVSHRSVSAVEFLRHFGITERSARRPAWLDDDVLCIDLKKPGQPVVSNRSRNIPPDIPGLGRDR